MIIGYILVNLLSSLPSTSTGHNFENHNNDCTGIYNIMNHNNKNVPPDCNIDKSDNYKYEPSEKPLICGEPTVTDGAVEGRNVDITHLVPVSHFSNVAQPLPVVTIAASNHNNAAYQQQVPVFNFNPAFFNYFGYYGKVGTSPGYPTGSFGSPGILLPAELPKLPAAPGFLTGAGYQPGHTLTPLRPLLPGHVSTPLHSAAIIGEKQKLADILQDKNVNLEARDGWGRVALVYTVLGNYQECTEMLLKAGAKPDATDSHNRTPLHYASYKGHLGCIKAILHAVEIRGISQATVSSGVWLAQDRRGVTPLHHAAVHDNHKCLQTLLKFAALGTLDTEDHKKRTPLHWAAAYGSEENVRLLIKHGANILLPDQEGKIPVHWASMSKAEGAKNCVRTLIGAAPSSVNWQDFDGITALHLAVAEARKDSVDVILSVPKCSINLTDNQYRTALHWACNRGLTSIVGCLVEQGSSLMVMDMYGATPLHYAAQLNHTDTVELVMRQPCVRDNPSKEGHTALHWAAARGADSALAAMVRHGASLTRTDPKGCTALHIAAGAGYVATVAVLLRLRAPVDVCALDGRTPLLHAAQAGHTQIVKVLVKAGASLDHRDNEGQCALHHAVLGGHLFLAQILLRAGTSVNIQDYSGRTPLHMAAFRGLSDIMFLLLENRGDVNARDNQGQSPLHWAAQQGHLGAVNTLLDFHAYLNYTQSTVDRYTALDCAYVAEHLEVAEVLMEAGGLSVTKIMEVAATKLQALVRGYIVRKNRQMMRSRINQRDEESFEITSKKSESLVKESDEQLLHSVSQESLHTESWVDRQLMESVSSFKCINNTNSNLNQKMEEEEDELRASPSPVLLRRAGQRRSKGLASSIMKGPRKKTLRNLDLPNPGELGIAQPLDHHTTGIDNDIVPESLTKETSLAIAGMLKRSGNIAAAVLSIKDENETTRTKSSDEENSEQKVNTDREFEAFQEYPQRQTANEVKYNIYKSFSPDNGIIDSTTEESQALNKVCVKQDDTLKYSSISMMDEGDKIHWNIGNQDISKKRPDINYHQSRKQILEEKTAASLRIIGGLDTGHNKYDYGQHPSMTAEMKQRAVERWNNKLASLKLNTMQQTCSISTKPAVISSSLFRSVNVLRYITILPSQMTDHPQPLQSMISTTRIEHASRSNMAWRWQRSAILALLLINSLFPCGGYADEEEATIVDETLLEEEEVEVVYVTPKPIEGVHLMETFDDIVAFDKNWVLSKAKKEGVDENIAKYDGKWSVEPAEKMPLVGDQGLVLKSKAKHAAISSSLKKPFVFNQKPFVVQYEVNFQNGQDCGGAYIKLLSKQDRNDLKNFNDKTPYTIMFGPDKCGNDFKLHFIFRHVNPLTGEIEEKHAKRPRDKIEEPFKDKKPHLYTLILHPDNTFEILLDNEIINSGSLLEDFSPPVNPPKEIDDPNDTMPEDWDEREKIPDPDATKPDDWDEDAPFRISDPDAVKPDGWMDDEPEMIPDPSSQKPDDWDDEMDGEWEAPLINNPKCSDAPGCGEWKAPVIDNPNYKGKWRPPMIDNPNYRGKWTPRKIPNPDYFEDLEPYKMTAIDSVGLELWSMSDDIFFDNIIVTDNIQDAQQFAAETFDLKIMKLEKGQVGVFRRIINYSNKNPWLYGIYVLLVAIPVVLIFTCCCAEVKDKDAERKKTDEPTEDDPQPEGDSSEKPAVEDKGTADQVNDPAASEDPASNAESDGGEDEEEEEEEEGTADDEKAEKSDEGEQEPQTRTSPRLRKSRRD
ncbi:hypothetical protein Pmani_009553 [Petrolisthes manimaculis]|uniref:Calnexin n=1 Tax=Petrolisthes manimaculis TaxID=1843537 RepID=A0AAE1Q396_9EUCA|nr:hypothetical protein Pmani_009553 [Petrolisthes manimaculis]